MATKTEQTTTQQERAGRVGQLAYDYTGSPGLAELLELGADRARKLAGQDTGPAEEVELSNHALELAARITTVADRAGEPRFALGDLVEILEETDERSGFTAVIEDRYISETGDGWEYQVRIKQGPSAHTTRSWRGRTQAQREHELAAI